MADLEELKPGYQVDGVLPDQPVTVVDVQWHGGDTVSSSTGTGGRTGSQLVFRKDAAAYDVETAAFTHPR